MWHLFSIPVEYHLRAQELGLVPAASILPPWRLFVPFSAWSPLPLSPLASPLFSNGLAHLALEVATAPFTLLYLIRVLPTRTLDEYLARLFLNPLGRYRDWLQRIHSRSGGANVAQVMDINRLSISLAHPTTQDLDGTPPSADDLTASTPPMADLGQETLASTSTVHSRQSASAWQPGHPLHAIFRAHIVGLIGLPLHALGARGVASHYIRRHGNPIAYGNILCFFRDPFAELPSLTFKSVGRMFAKAALCLALSCAYSSAVWGIEVCITAFIKPRWLRWRQSQGSKAPEA